MSDKRMQNGSIKLRIILLPLIVLFAFLLTNCKTTSTRYQFFVAGHVYGTPGDTLHTIYPPFEQCFSQINETNHAFGVFTGDMVQFSSKTSWNVFDSVVHRLKPTIYRTPGNHDMGDRPLYESRYGKTDSCFQLNDDWFVLLDNTKNGWGLDSSQMEIIRSVIEQCKENKRIFIFMHNVLWHSIHDDFAPNSLAGKAPEPYFNFHSTVLPILNRSKKEIYLIAGDVGATQSSKNVAYAQQGNVHFVTSGMGNEINDNYLIFTVDKKVNIEVYSLKERKLRPISNYFCE